MPQIPHKETECDWEVVCSDVWVNVEKTSNELPPAGFSDVVYFHIDFIMSDFPKGGDKETTDSKDFCLPIYFSNVKKIL